ncbi:c-Myc-binding protein homolog [Ceratitis capitata]|uniref:(Mediterranean fruit fly) hypothetical protein n=1 Tax=Ceratitis capitata TaxID=7213 RepID=W8BQP9_CERCA|nr:c-Myc-binding protein homolog [Ceratitis capitata]CAD6991223.1 unnamed protein product [Ceratitis capitata]
MAFKPIDPKRDEFRRYLERAGVIEALTKVFVRLVKERPEKPLDYLRHNLGDAKHQADSMAYLQSELEEARNEIQRLRGVIESINPEALKEQQESREDTEKNHGELAEGQGNDISKSSVESEPIGEANESESNIEPLGTCDPIETDNVETKVETAVDTAGVDKTINVVTPNIAQNIDNN